MEYNTISQLVTKNANILEISYDFATYKNKHNTYFKNKEEELEIRYNNLQDIINIFNKYNILHWLQGKTMLGIYKYGKLLENDSDEDIGTDSSNIFIVCTKILPELLALGFEVIRATSNNSMLTVMRNKRYLDICFFKDINDKYYYEKKIFPKIFYNDFKIVKVKNFDYNIPQKSDEICKYSYNI